MTAISPPTEAVCDSPAGPDAIMHLRKPASGIAWPACQPVQGTLHRLENGHRTGVMWGPSVEGNWYASRAAVNQGETFKFAEQRHADAFLHAPIDTDAVFTGHMHYSYRTISGYRHFLWHHHRADAVAEAGADAHVIIAEPCRCDVVPGDEMGTWQAAQSHRAAGKTIKPPKGEKL